MGDSARVSVSVPTMGCVVNLSHPELGVLFAV